MTNCEEPGEVSQSSVDLFWSDGGETCADGASADLNTEQRATLRPSCLQACQCSRSVAETPNDMLLKIHCKQSHSIFFSSIITKPFYH